MVARDADVLLVEDDPNDEALTLLAFEQAGLSGTVHVARDGQEALDYLLARGANRPAPRLVLLDLKLPGLSGFDVLERLRANPGTRTQPVVVLSASGEERDLVRSYELGANGYIRKPVELSAFQRAMRSIRAFWLEFNVVPGH